MSRDRTGESWRRTDSGEDVVGYVKRSDSGPTLYRGGQEFACQGIPYTKWYHFVRVTLPSGEVVHRKWSEDSDFPWERYTQRIQ